MMLALGGPCMARILLRIRFLSGFQSLLPADCLMANAASRTKAGPL